MPCYIITIETDAAVIQTEIDKWLNFTMDKCRRIEQQRTNFYGWIVLTKHNSDYIQNELFGENGLLSALDIKDYRPTDIKIEEQDPLLFFNLK